MIDILLWLSRFAFAALVYWFLFDLTRSVMAVTTDSPGNVSKPRIRRGAPWRRARTVVPQTLRLVSTQSPVERWLGPGDPDPFAGPERWEVVLPDQSFPLGPILIGRSAENHFRLADRFASALHARIFPEGGSFWVEDLGSTNGTYVNSDRVVTKRRLGVGDALRIGETCFMLER